MSRLVLLVVLALLLPRGAASAAPTTRPYFAGADVSMLPALEASGAVYRDDEGRPCDAIRTFREHGVELFRLRVFVNPTDDFTQSWGATQDLAALRKLAKRVKAGGAAFLLDLHYSDSWADPANQTKPTGWEDLHGEALERKVHDYTAEVLAALQADGTPPDLVQIGNEITSGMLWPDGKLTADPAHWAALARLLSAGSRAVREASTPLHPIRVMLHVDGGDKPGRVAWWFGELAKHNADYDVIGLSYYPMWSDDADALANLKENLRVAAETFRKDVIVVETAYPYRDAAEPKPAMRWPATPAGQASFLRDLTALVKATPDGHGRGVIYWYPESSPPTAHGVSLWEGGRCALFDAEGRPLPGLRALGGGGTLIEDK